VRRFMRKCLHRLVPALRPIVIVAVLAQREACDLSPGNSSRYK